MFDSPFLSRKLKQMNLVVSIVLIGAMPNAQELFSQLSY